MKDAAATSASKLASAVNLTVHPAGGAMALSALGLGLAGQAFGMWFGAVSGAAEMSQRYWGSMLEEIVSSSPVRGTFYDGV
ncbi:hypothetical protein [Arvimicrobium flavum]|uniref:hypothetical protein n=1 Tax=Arvimicrobium flavum TaxID=3393320 RepID=UPI00237AA850|nr:hypothetical protein [Mesorhizobium shangrilense]